jgi:hypothetical protein
MKWSCLVLVIVSISAHAATTYYIDSARGSDANPGNTQAAPWKTLQKINQSAFQPGDRILLKSGSEWQGQLAPGSSGAAQQPIMIASYGKGPMPRIDGAGEVEDVIRLYNVEEIEVRGLEITNKGSQPAPRRGVHIFLDNFGTGRHIVISDLYVHDVNGTNGKKDNGGIIFRTNGNRKPSRFDGLTIERNIIWKVDRSAIAAESYHARRSRWFPSLHVVIRDNYVDDIGGDGIVPWATDGALVEGNIARECNQRAGDYNAGIWQWSTDNTLLRLNEASFTRTTRDGEGFDSDYNSRNTTFEMNYSHDNRGGFMLICAPVQRDQSENIGNTGTVLHHNISRNDHERLINLSGADHTTVDDNAFYVSPGENVQLFVSDWHGWSKGALFKQNTFYVGGSLAFGHGLSKNEVGQYTIAPGWPPAQDIVFDSNRYIGSVTGRPEDPHAVVESASKPPKVDWKEPTFDPAKPRAFGLFLTEHRKWMERLFQQQFGIVAQQGASGESQ